MTIPNFRGQRAGKSFEKICLEVSNLDDRMTFGRYGVQATLIDGLWTPVVSLPDFEGVLRSGRQMIFDAKVCSQSKFPLAPFTDRRGNKRRQLDHMLQRSEFNVICFFLIHWNERELKTKHEPAETFAFPVSLGHPHWEAFDRRESMSITRDDCRTYGAAVNWIYHTNRGRKLRPDIFEAIQAGNVW